MTSEDPGSLCKNISNSTIRVREMDIGDLAPVYYLGERLFTRNAFPVLYRTWDTFEVTQSYDTDPELCLVAETADGKVIGFALGTTIEKEGSAWKYGYLSWLGVAPEHQGKKVAEKLLREFERRVKEEGARILLVDTEADNYRAIKFFHGHGFAQPKSHVWLSKSLSRSEQMDMKPMKPAALNHKRGRKKGKRLEESVAPGPTPGPVVDVEVAALPVG